MLRSTGIVEHPRAARRLALGFAATALAVLALWGVAGLRSGLGRPLVVALAQSTSTLDPHLHNEIVLSTVLSNFYEGLVAFDPEMRLVPSLAVAWQRLDGHRVRFELRPGIRFHDGEPLTAADVVASLLRGRNHPRSGIAHHLVDVAAVEAEGEHAVVVHTSGPAATLLDRLVFVAVVPRRLAAEEEILEPVGTGPYRFVRRAADGTLVARWAGGWHRRPPFRTVHFRLGFPQEQQLALFMSGGVDVLAWLPDRALRFVSQDPDVRPVPQPRLSVQILSVVPAAVPGDARAWLADRRVRRALLLGIDRQRLVEQGYRGNGTVASQYVHPVVFGFDSGLAPCPFDREAARRILAEVGDVPDVELVLGHPSSAPVVIEAILEDLRHLGVRARAQSLPFDEFLRRARNQELPLLYYGRTAATGDASDVLNAMVHSPDAARGWGRENFTGFSNPRVDALLERCEQELAPDIRRAMLHEVQRLVLDELPMLPLTIRFGHVGVSKRVDMTPRFDQRLLVAEFRRR